ncbi:alpha/beta hydrolase [Nonomuraea sp. NPDC050663]|uniref:alpha/beta hydrolase n=1 Tax=Nonomuraea sp. NPDC050663 TaxID=3364370 RepID=UPI00379A1E4C
MEAFRAVAALATEHAADLDAATRVMAASAWVGGGAPHFTASLATHRSSIQSAFSMALAALAGEVVRRGEPAPAAPSIATQVPIASATHGPFRGIDTQAMRGLVTMLDQAAERLPAAGARVRALLSATGQPASPGWTIAAAGQWSGTQAPDLRRRLARIQRDSPWLPSDSVAFDLFGGYATATDPDTLLAKVASGDPAALTQLLARRDPGLAARVHAWWHRLPATVQERLTRLPGFGSLNGLPAAIRDQANRAFLTTEKQRLQAQLDQLAHVMEDLSALAVPASLVARDQIGKLLRNIAMIERALAAGGRDGHPPALLLALDLHGTGRLVVSWGDPDAADTVVTYVPGLNTELAGFAGDIDRARVLWQQSQATAGKQAIASIAWLGYDAPQLENLLDAPASVASDAPAERGAVELAAFSDGLRAAGGEGTRYVVLGHSYGSLVSGKAALLRPGRLADEFVFVGSPGVGVEHARELKVGAERVWVGEDPNDPVAMLGRFTRDPGDAGFGGRVFSAGSRHVVQAHSGYWDAHTPSLLNMARIVNGEYDGLVTPLLDIQPQLLLPQLRSSQ